MKYPDTKKVILEKSLDFFSKYGYAGASIRQIAKAVGIRESAIYNHFKSKEEIFLDILSNCKSKNIIKDILTDKLLDDLSNPQKFLLGFATKIIEKWNEPAERKFIRLLMMEQFTKIGSQVLSVSDYLIELRSVCKMIFNEMIKAGIVKNNNVDVLVGEFVTPLFFLRTEHMSGEDEGDLNKVYEAAEKHVEFFWNAIKI